jgi:hypothetical protein
MSDSDQRLKPLSRCRGRAGNRPCCSADIWPKLKAIVSKPLRRHSIDPKHCFGKLSAIGLAGKIAPQSERACIRKQYNQRILFFYKMYRVNDSRNTEFQAGMNPSGCLVSRKLHHPIWTNLIGVYKQPEKSIPKKLTHFGNVFRHNCRDFICSALIANVCVSSRNAMRENIHMLDLFFGQVWRWTVRYDAFFTTDAPSDCHPDLAWYCHDVVEEIQAIFESPHRPVLL